MTYALLWWRGYILLTTLGVGLAFLVWSPGLVAAMWLLTAFLSGLLLALATTSTPGSVGSADSHPSACADLLGVRGPQGARRTVAAWSAMVASTAVALSAVGAVSGLVASALAAGTLVSSPWFLTTVDTHLLTGRAHAGHGGAGAPQALPATDAEDLGAGALRRLDNVELCQGWRRTFVALERSIGSPVELMRVVTLRQRYLDEMDRRDPAGLHAWLASGAPAAGGPDRFLTDDPGPGRPRGV